MQALQPEMAKLGKVQFKGSTNTTKATTGDDGSISKAWC